MIDLDKRRRDIIKALWRSRPDDAEVFLESTTFVTADDGDMGSFSIRGEQARKNGQILGTAESADADGVQLVITLFGDIDGYPTELDIWKVDFSPTISLPQADALQAPPDPLPALPDEPPV